MRNHKRMSMMTLVLSLSMLTGTLWPGSMAVGQSAPKTPTAQELLQKYTKALDATQSFTDTYEEVVVYSNKTFQSMECKLFGRGINRADGKRTYCQKYIWGDFSSNMRDLPEDKPQYHLRVDADKKVYVNSSAINSPGVSGTANLQPSMVDTARLNMEMFAGVYGHIGCDIRLHAVLADAKKISVRQATEEINTVPCYVIDADTHYGQYTVWLDPNHGYNAAKVTRKAIGGHKEQEWPMQPGDRASGSLLVTRFEQVDGTWAPVEAEYEASYVRGKQFRRNRCYYKRANIVFNPDHDKLGSFDNPLLDNPANDPELKDGIRVSILLPDPPTIKGTWKDGKVIDESGKVINVSELWATMKNSSAKTDTSSSNRSNRPNSSNRSSSSRRRRAY